MEEEQTEANGDRNRFSIYHDEKLFGFSVFKGHAGLIKCHTERITTFRIAVKGLRRIN